MSILPSAVRRLAGPAFITTALVALSLNAQPAPQALDPFITTATRTPAPVRTVGSSVSTSSATELARSQLNSLGAAIGLVAGAPAFASGAPGSTTSVFLRGSNSNHTLFLVDGIRLNDSNTDYQVFLGGATLGEGDVIEIARGPQSTLYGSDAIGGVVSIRAARGSGPSSGLASLEGGSFGSVAGSLASQGGNDVSGWNFSARAAHTDNERANNEHDSINTSLRFDRRISAAVAAGATVRYYHGELGSPGDRFTNDPNNNETESNVLATAFVELKSGSDWTTRATLGGQERRYVAESPAPNPPWGFGVGTAVTKSRRAVLDLQSTYAGFDRHKLTTGATAELKHARSSGFGAIDRHEQLLALFAQDEIALTDSLYVTGGVRRDDFDTFGAVTTGRATVAWLPIRDALKLRASYGTGFHAPSFLDLYGRDAYYVGNPNLSSERARGVDAGFDWYLPERRGTVSVTAFRSDFRNLIEYDFMVFPSTVRNVGRARTTGVEFLATAKLGAGADAMIGYTYLDARTRAPSAEARLLRRPRHQLFGDVRHTLAGRFTFGAGVRVVAGREDVDAAQFVPIDAEDFTVVRMHASWQVTPALVLRARIENALDENYEEVHGYPTPGVGVFAGLDWKF